MDHEKSLAGGGGDGGGGTVTVEPRAHSSISPSQKTALPRWSGKGKERSSIALACTWVVENQINIAVYLLSTLFLTHVAFPPARHHTRKFFRISYYNEQTGTFALGWDDIFFVFYWIIVFSGMRCAVMDYILIPVARWADIKKKKARVRFAEQAWILIYYGAFWSCGVYIMATSPYFFSLRALWQNWPTRSMSGLSKWYYLVQFAFWLQQIVVVNIEERRKDYAQMFTHHIITCALIFTSYGYHQTKVGNVILVLMDVSDLFLPLAKVLKYLNWRKSCDVAFGVFMVTWFAARHVLYMCVCWSIYKHIPEEIQYGCYRGGDLDLKGPFPVPNDFDHLTQPFRDPVGLVCWNDSIKWVFLGMLLALQCVLLVWFAMIVKVAWKVLSGEGADDTRSDDEDDEEEDEEEESDEDFGSYRADSHAATEKSRLLASSSSSPSQSPSPEKENGSLPAAGPPIVRRSSRMKRAAEAHTTGVNLLAHSDRKEFLGRIGCDKPA